MLRQGYQEAKEEAQNDLKEARWKLETVLSVSPNVASISNTWKMREEDYKNGMKPWKLLARSNCRSTTDSNMDTNYNPR